MKEVIKEENLLPCYFFYGEETFLAYQFIQQLKEALISPDIQEYNVEKFSLEESSWGEIIDLARTIPFFFSPWRIISVEIHEGEKGSLSQKEERILKDYFSSPSAKSILVIIYRGKRKKDFGLFRLLSSLPPHLVSIKELKPLRDRALYAWMDRKLSSRGKSATSEAKQRLEEIKGNNLALLDNELEKLMAYVDDKKIIELDDVNQVSGWAKTFVEWELTNSLEKGDFKQSLIVLNNLFKEGVKPQYILGVVANFFRDIFLAKLWLKEKNKERKAIFKELRPQIQEKFGRFYSTKFDEFFSLVESIPMNVLNRILKDLEKIDVKVKTSGASYQMLLEKFLFDFYTLRREKRLLGRRGVD